MTARIEGNDIRLGTQMSRFIIAVPRVKIGQRFLFSLSLCLYQVRQKKVMY